MFIKEETLNAFNSWLKDWGITPHPNDQKDFNHFAKIYCKNEESVSKENFVRETKKKTHTTRNFNRGICQKYYEKLQTICDFVKYSQIKLK